MACKVTLFFNMFESGFSETYYHPSSSPRALEISLPNALWQKAVKFRYTGCFLKAIRITLLESTRESVLIRPYPKAQGTRAFVSAIGPDVASTTAVFALKGGVGPDRRVWLRGLSDFDVVRDEFGNDIGSQQLHKMTDDYFGALYTYDFKIRRILRPPESALTWRKVFNIHKLYAVGPNRANLIMLDDAPTYSVGDKVSVTGIPSSLPRFPRTLTILGKQLNGTLTSYEFAYQLPGGVEVRPANMRFTGIIHAYESISDWAFERYGEHKTGRPFGSLRGRSRAVRL